MIDRAKNICYWITVPYVLGDRFDTDYKYQKFLSLHSMHSKYFESFRDKYFKEVLQVPINSIGEWDKSECTLGTQRTISWHAWRTVDGLREQVMEGITEREKCR